MHRPLQALAAALCLLLAAVAGAAAPRHDLVRVPLDDPANVAWLRQNRNAFDIVREKPGVEAHIACGPGDEEALRAAGLSPELLQRDMEAA